MMKMIAPFLLAAIAAAPAAAKDSHVGTWHSAEAKSFWSNGEFPKGFSLTTEMTFSDERVK